MPIHLPPLSRRDFLAGAAAAASTLVFKGALRGVEEGAARDPHRFALLSDTHVAADRAFVHKTVNLTEHLSKVVAEVAALSPAPAWASINGDLAFGTGQAGDYAVLLDLLRPLRGAGLPVHLGLGNHDNRERFRAALPEGDRVDVPLKDRHAYLVESPRADWFILDSLIDTNKTPGTVGEAQLRWLAERLDDAGRKDKPALVMVHHNPDLDPAHNALLDTQALLDLLKPRKRAKALFFGHTHMWSAEEQAGLHLINLPAVAYVFHEGQPSGWGDFHLAEMGATLELRCIDPSHKQHGEKKELRWRDT